jgi:hypothetical protein
LNGLAVSFSKKHWKKKHHVFSPKNQEELVPGFARRLQQGQARDMFLCRKMSLSPVEILNFQQICNWKLREKTGHGLVKYLNFVLTGNYERFQDESKNTLSRRSQLGQHGGDHRCS